jgi:hypothetical protein
MREVSQEQQAEAMEVLRRNEDRLRGLGGVHYVDVGYEFVNGEPTERLAIRVHVHKKQPESALDPADVAPRELDGIPVDVIQSNPEAHQLPRDQRYDPLEGGVEIGNTNLSVAGTLGVLVFDAQTPVAMGLSCHHVLVAGTGAAADVVAQPQGNATNDAVGTLERWDAGLDCAVCIIDDMARGLSTGIVDYPSGTTKIAEPLIGVAVTKSGRTTGTTFGLVDGVSVDEFTVVPDPANPAPNDEISARGDSGSVWLRVSDSAALGLHFQGETSTDPADERAWAKRMAKVAQTLDIRVLPPVSDLQLVLDGSGQVWAKATIWGAGWTHESPAGHVAIAAGGHGLQMLLDGAGKVWAKESIGDGGWTPETPNGHIEIAAGGDGLQMVLDGAGKVWAKNSIGDGGWTPETPNGHTAIDAGGDGLQMLLDGAGRVWAKTSIGDGGWTAETPSGHVAIAAGQTYPNRFP